MPLTVNKALCEGCGTCIEACPAGVLALEDGKVKVVNVDACMECRACEVQCPNGAISLG